MRKMPLQMRITLLTGLMILLTALAMTGFSIYNAGDKLQLVQNDYVQYIDEIQMAVPVTSAGGLSSSVRAEPSAATLQQASTVPAVALDAQEIQAMAVTISATAQKSFNTWSLVFLVVISCLGMALAYYLSGRALRPVRDLSNAVKGITEHSLKERIPVQRTGDELSSLTEEFNALMERLEESFYRQKRFSANAAHELKTPLATMLANVQVLNMDEVLDVKECKETLPILEENLKRLARVVEDLLVMNGEQKLEACEAIDLEQMTDAILGELRPMQWEKELRVETDFEFKTIWGREALVYRLLFNLVENGMKYNCQGGSVVILAKEVAGKRRIEVLDTGMGLEEGSAEEIFEPFYRGSEVREPGSGLGLSLAKAIAEKHGWKIWAENRKDGSGCRVIINV